MGRDRGLQARMDSYLRRLKVLPLPWPFPLYRPLGGGIGEIRFDLGKVEHRLYGYFGPRSNQFTIMLAASGKGNQQAKISAAKKLNKKYQVAAPEVDDYDV